MEITILYRVIEGLYRGYVCYRSIPFGNALSQGSEVMGISSCGDHSLIQ